MHLLNVDFNFLKDLEGSQQLVLVQTTNILHVLTFQTIIMYTLFSSQVKKVNSKHHKNQEAIKLWTLNGLLLQTLTTLVFVE